MLRHMNMLVAANIDFTCQPSSAERTGKISCRRSLLGEAKLSRKYKEVFLETGRVQLNAGTVHEDSVKNGNGSNVNLQMTHAARNAISRKFRKVFGLHLWRATTRATIDADVATQIASRSMQGMCYPAQGWVTASLVLVEREADMEG